MSVSSRRDAYFCPWGRLGAVLERLGGVLEASWGLMLILEVIFKNVQKCKVLGAQRCSHLPSGEGDINMLIEGLGFARGTAHLAHGLYRRPSGSVAGLNRSAHAAGPGTAEPCFTRYSGI